MSRRLLSKGEQRLVDRLRQEAIETRPAYSESLHKRILAAVRQQPREKNPAAPRRQPADTRRSMQWMAAAAVCLAIVAVLQWQSDQRATDQNAKRGVAIAYAHFDDELPRRAVTAVLLPCTPVDEWSEKSVNELSNMAVIEAIAPHSAKLQHDARLAAEAVLMPLPIDLDMFVAQESCSMDLAVASER